MIKWDPPFLIGQSTFFFAINAVQTFFFSDKVVLTIWYLDQRLGILS